MIPSRPSFCGGRLWKGGAKCPFGFQKGPVLDPGCFVPGAGCNGTEMFPEPLQRGSMRMGSKEGKAVFPKPVGLRNTELVGIPQGSSPELSLDPCPMLGGSRQQDLPRRGVKMGRQGATLSQQRHF